MARGQVIKALAVNADDSIETDANEPLDRMPLPTLDERANFYLRAVYGERQFSNEEYSGARDLMLRAMANDITARSNGRSFEEASLPLDEPPDASLSAGAQHNGLTAFDDASLLLGASEQPTEDSGETVPEATAREPRAFLQ